MPFEYDTHSAVLEFHADPDCAPGLARRDEAVRLRLFANEDGVIAEGTFSVLYVADVATTFHADERHRVAVKVFKDPVYEDDAYREHDMLCALGGLHGYLPRAVAFGHVMGAGDHGVPRPAIMQEFVDGESVMDTALSLEERFPDPDVRLEKVIEMIHAITCAVVAINDTAEVRHGDLSYTNVLLRRDGRRGYRAVLIDLGQAAPKRRPDTFVRSGTEFFSAPEIFGGNSPWHEADYVRGRSSADVYSIGALWAYLLRRGRHVSDDDFLKGYNAARKSWGNGIARWATPDDVGNALLASTVGSLVDSCMRLEPGDRRSLSDVSEDLRDLCTPQLRTQACLSDIMLSANGQHVLGDVLPSPYPIRPSQRVAGRDAELAELARLLGEGRVAYLCGFGGIGKSTIATGFASEALTEGGYHGVSIRRAYLIPFSSSVEETLATVASSLTDRFGAHGMDKAAGWVLDVLEGALWEDDLVILDDVYVPGRTLMDVAGGLLGRMARNGRYKLIITSRYPATGYVADCVVRTDGLSDESLGEVFRRQAGPGTYDDALLARLFEAVDRNTLVVKLVGGLVGGGLIDLEEVVEVLESGSLGNDVIDALSVANHDDGVQANIRGHVARLLSLTAEALTAEERDLMARLLMLPRQGVGIKTLGQVIRRERPELVGAFAALRDKGLVERMPQGTRVRLHTLVRSVCLETEGFALPLDPSQGFLRELGRLAQDALEVGNLAVVLDAEAIYRSAVELARRQGLDAFVDTLLSRRGDVLRELGRPCERQLVTGELLDRLTLRLTDGRDAGVSWRAGTTDADVEEWARLAADHVEALTDAGCYQEAIDQADEALQTIGWDDGRAARPMPAAQLTGTRRSLAARLLSSRGGATLELWMRGRRMGLADALADKRQAYEMIAETGDAWEMAKALTTLAFTEHHAGACVMAIHDAESSIALVGASAHQPERERALLLATSLNYLGFFLCNYDDCVEGRLRESLDLKEEAIRIRYRYLPPVHIDIARSHNNVSYSLRRLSRDGGDPIAWAALDHALVARRIRNELRGDGREVSMTLVDENIESLRGYMGLEQRDIGQRYERTGVPASYQRV